MMCRSEVFPQQLAVCTFHLDDVRAASVALVGSFNRWSTTANLMQRVNGRWELHVALPPGRHEYCFFALERDDSLHGSIIRMGSNIDVKMPKMPMISVQGENFAPLIT